MNKRVEMPLFPETEKRSNSRRIAVCFADIRGFTSFAYKPNARIDEVLSCLFGSVNSAFKAALSNLEGELQKSIQELVQPTAVKALGDGLMLVWEYPQKIGPTEVDIGFALWMLDFVVYLQTDFRARINELVKKFMVEKLDLGIGLSAGNAWMVSDPKQSIVDYIGNPVNVAARLQAKARPGIVADLYLAPELFRERCCFGEGKIYQEEVRGISDPIPVWAVDTIQPRRSGRPTSIEAVLSLLSEHSYARSPNRRAPLTRDDTETMFDAREKFEGQFAFDLALRVRNEEINDTELEPVEKTILAMERMLADNEVNDLSAGPPEAWNALGVTFHTQIASLSDGNKHHQHKELAEKIYKFTRHKYLASTTLGDLHAVLSEHREIFNAIRTAQPEKAKERMQEHLMGHYSRERKALLGTPTKWHNEKNSQSQAASV